jgi:hypothetical protein
MPRFLLLTGVVLLMADYAFAQDSPYPTPLQCQLIRQAVAQYGFAAARRHALETYGPEAVKTGDKCFAKRTGGPQASQSRAMFERWNVRRRDTPYLRFPGAVRASGFADG